MALTKDELRQKETQIDALALEIYENSERAATPMFPQVFVRVLPKEHLSASGRIILQGIDQNKPMHEGIVLATWQPKTFEFGKVAPDGARHTKQVVRRSDFKPGDHVLFPHWAGAPIWGYDETRYRSIFELNWDFSDKGGIVATIQHVHPDDTPRGILEDILGHVGWVGGGAAAIAHKIEDRLQLLDRAQGSLTLSGR